MTTEWQQWLSDNYLTIVIVVLVVLVFLATFLVVWEGVRKKRVRKWIRRGKAKPFYLISDTHFDHTNIIRHCRRPFRNKQEMNRALIRNWNRVVRKGETVYFLGDWAFGRGARPPGYWIKRLNGHIISLRGSHDRNDRKVRFHKMKILSYNGYRFLLIHDPSERPKNWDGWIIHGHKHNNSRIYPFINGKRKTINVSVELINHTPLSIDSLLNLNINSIKRMEGINSTPKRW